MELTKECSRCHEVKPYSAFSPRNGDKMKPRSRCKPCQAEISRLNNRGISKAHFDSLMDRANHQCEACGKKKWLAVDHNHQTGITRGILCRRCNGVLGMMEDNAEAIQQLADYLRRR